MRVDVDVSGVESLQAKLDQLTKKQIERAAAVGLEVGAVPIVEKVKALAPVKTGKLRESIKVRAAKRKRSGEVRRVVGPGAVSKDGVRYGYVVERRRSYIRAGFDATANQAAEATVQAIGDAIEQAWSEL